MFLATLENLEESYVCDHFGLFFIFWAQRDYFGNDSLAKGE